MRDRVCQAMLVFAAMAANGCYARFDVAATRASYAAPSADPAYQKCAAGVVAAQESFNAHGQWWSRSVVAGIVLGAAVSAAAIATARDTPGGDASTPAEAVDSERALSGLELTTAGLAVLAGADALLAWYSTSGMARNATQVAAQLARCPPASPASTAISVSQPVPER